MASSEPNIASCKLLFVADRNILDDSFESRGQRALFHALHELGMPIAVLCRFLTSEDTEVEMGPWLAKRDWQPEPAKDLSQEEKKAEQLSVTVDGLAVTLLRGASTKQHDPNEEERSAFARLATAHLIRTRPDVVVARSGATALRRLSEKHAWPEQQPEDAAPGQEQGWLGNGTEVMLSRTLASHPHVIVELGAWLGMSTRFIANQAPAATVISVDRWEGSPEHQTQERFQKLLPKLYETFQARCWPQRQRIVPLRMSTLDGLKTVADSGVKPDFIFVDAEHSYKAVTAELTLARQLFPQAALGGDDYDWSGVRAAVDGFARRHGMVVDRFGGRGWRLLENWQAGEANYPPLRLRL